MEWVNAVVQGILLGGLFATLFLLTRIARQRASAPSDPQHPEPMIAEYEAEIRTDLSTFMAATWLLIGLLLLLFSSRILVWGAVEIAVAFGVSDLLIGLTIVAIGTSLPELAASVVSALRGEHEIAVGNVIGSNIYNLLAVLSLPGLLAPGAVADVVLERDLLLMLGLTLALLAMGYGHKGHGKINRLEGSLLLLVFLGYQTWLYLDATGQV